MSYSNIGKNRAKRRQANKRYAWVTQCPPGWRVIVPVKGDFGSSTMVHSVHWTKADAVRAAAILRANRAPKLTRNKQPKVEG